MELNPVLITAKVTDILETLNVRYFISGSLASTLYGMIRTTQDSDVVADLGQENISSFVSALEEDFYIDQEMIVNAVAKRTSFHIIHRESFFKVDVFIPKLRPYVQEQFSRARRQIFSRNPKIEALVASAEDTLLAKPEWYRQGGEISDRQWRGFLGVLKVQAGSLELDYLNRMADELHINDLLEKALAEA